MSDSGRKRQILAIVVLSALFLGGLAAGLIMQTRQGLRIGEFLFRQTPDSYVRGDTCFAVQRSDTGLSGTLTVEGAELVVTMDRINERQVRFTLPDGTKTVCNINHRNRLEMGEDENLTTRGMTLEEKGRMQAWGEKILNDFADDAPQALHNLNIYTMMNALWRVYTDQMETWGSWMFAVPYVLLFVMGAVAFLYPEEVYMLGNYWQFEKGKNEANRRGVLLVRVVSPLLMLLALFFALSPLVIGG